ncbi:hypothetical protein [Demequina flava]|uniref:hypothetical protein n=1 Tax=Demequina flava TaxID=1095025 RepID=UPI00128C6218|nr:hypothetical protein [Demequina flava]
MSPPLDEWTGTQRRSDTRLKQFTRTHNDLCTQAVDSFEIAAGLEAAGVSDSRARSEFGAASVFELAEAMYALVPRRPTTRAKPVDRWARPPHRHLLRGLLYGLPGLLYAVALTMLHAGFNGALLLGSAMFAAGLGQAVAVLGNVLLGRKHRGAASAFFRLALLVGAVSMTCVMAVAWTSRTLSSSLVVATFLILYLLAATVLMVEEADLLLLAVLTPGVIVAVAALADVAVVPRAATVAVLSFSVIGAVVAGWVRVSVKPKSTVAYVRAGFGLGRHDYLLAARYFVYGIVTAVLGAFAVVDAIMRGTEFGPGPIALMMLPLIASLGVAEWFVYTLRSQAVTALHGAVSIDSFRASARTLLLRALLMYCVVLGFLSTTVVLIYGSEPRSVFVLNTVAYAVLGLSFFCGTLLLSLGRRSLALALTAVALLVDTAFRFLLASSGPEALAVAHLATFLMLLFLIVPVTLLQYSRAGVHR